MPPFWRRRAGDAAAGSLYGLHELASDRGFKPDLFDKCAIGPSFARFASRTESAAIPAIAPVGRNIDWSRGIGRDARRFGATPTAFKALSHEVTMVDANPETHRGPIVRAVTKVLGLGLRHGVLICYTTLARACCRHARDSMRS